MSNTWGQRLKITVFGESHGPGLGVVVDGLPPGFPVDWDKVRSQMARRAPGSSDLSTPRKEADEAEILSGFYQGATTGRPLCAVIRNTDTRSRDYDPSIPRPGTADLTAHIKYKGFQDPRGSGSFSGRLTAALVFAGAIARQVLEERGITIGARIARIAGIDDTGSLEPDPTLLGTLAGLSFPVLDEERRKAMQAAIRRARDEGDSVGGIVECAACGVPAGLGEPFFESFESSVASMLYSIPAVKGVEFGTGFAIADLTGFAANDSIYHDGSAFRTRTNHNGGINGGITNGMPVVFRVAFKPPASIGKEQDSAELATGEPRRLAVVGRHDPCIVHRAVVVVEAALALCLLDLLLVNGGTQ